jgi:hypothetical protein
LNEERNSNQIQTSSEVLKYSKDVLSACPTDRYLVITQPGVNSVDLNPSDTSACAIPHLCQAAQDSRIQGEFTVAEVVGDVASSCMADYIKTACAQKDKKVIVDEVSLASLSNDDRAGALVENGRLRRFYKLQKARLINVADNIVARSIEKASASGSYTILFMSSPREPTYEADFAEPLHLDLKRNLRDVPVPRQSNISDGRQLPLFEKYQFFTPGLFSCTPSWV